MLFFVLTLVILNYSFCISLHFISFSAHSNAKNSDIPCCNISENPTRGILSCARQCSIMEICDGYIFSQNACVVLLKRESDECDDDSVQDDMSRELTRAGHRVFLRKDRLNAKCRGKDAWCPSSFTYNSTLQFCFKIANRTVVNYNEAEAECTKLHSRGRLVKLNTTQKHEAVKEELKKSIWWNSFTNPHIFIGAKGNAVFSNSYRWTDGSEVTSNYSWCKGQPQMLECIRLWPEKNYCFDDGWCSIRGDRLHKNLTYICEISMKDD